MSAAQGKVIITCAVTGSIHTPSMSPHLPVTPAEVARAAIGAAQAGAAIVHLHARNPQDGRKLFQIEHEVRSMKHPLFNRPLVNRNPGVTNMNYQLGQDAFRGAY